MLNCISKADISPRRIWMRPSSFWRVTYCLAATIFLSPAVRADDGTRVTNWQALPGINIRSETRTNPPTRLIVAVIDLSTPDIHLHVANGGPDPDGPGPWQTILMQPTRVAEREKFDLEHLH